MIIRNTFIDGFAEEELCSRLPGMRRMSAPATSHRVANENNGKVVECAWQSASECSNDEFSPSQQTCFYESEASTCSDPSDGSWASMSVSIDADMDCIWLNCGGLSDSSSESEAKKMPAKRADRESVGSADHYLGSCRPCIWFWRESSCSKGSDCQYCHLCDEAAVERAIKKRQRQQKTKKMLMRRDYRAQGFQISAQASPLWL